MIRRAWFLPLFLLLFAGCGSAKPTVSELRLSDTRVNRGTDLYLTLAGVEDPDGNVYAGRVEVTTRSLVDGEDLELQDSVEVFEPEREGSRGDIIVALRLFGRVPFGACEFEVVFEDEAGVKSDPVKAEATIVQRSGPFITGVP